MNLVLAPIVAERWFEPDRVKPEIINMAFTASPRNTEY
jgi:hypothetical protein